MECRCEHVGLAGHHGAEIAALKLDILVNSTAAGQTILIYIASKGYVEKNNVFMSLYVFHI